MPNCGGRDGWSDIRTSPTNDNIDGGLSFENARPAQFYS